MRLKDHDAFEAWSGIKDANKDGYGATVVRYAEQWADTMEIYMWKGEELENCAKKASYEANTEGITGYMHGVAVSILVKVWVHGERLRRWHNLDTQIGNEGERANETGGVLNPAIMNVGKKEG